MSFLTKNEKRVIIFLIAGAILGIGYSYYKEFYPPLRISSKKDQFRPRPVIRRDLDRALKEAKAVNINTASLEELMRLEGVGPVMANRIIEYRSNKGLFSSKEELKEVRGMGGKKFDAIKDYIEVE
ncbi:MAG: helix-hairpin-helix domain-containing protein [Candidatus Omnitrophica bacterium]|nr:helix-hairpin-helix domain-containing protein [Candidatus Omnitrophota bacterium]